MEFGLSEQQEKFRQEVRDFLDREIPSSWAKTSLEAEEQIDNEEEWAFYKSIQHKLAGKGWLSIHWPKEYGGLGRSYTDFVIFIEEMSKRGAPGISPGATWHIVPTLLACGTEEQKKIHLPPIARGETMWYNALSEPNAGSDVANISTTAVPDGDDYIINGQKSLGAYGRFADWCFFLVRTDPNSSGHRGLSMFMADLKTPGITMKSVNDMADYGLWIDLFLNNVRLPKENMIGDKDQAWKVVTTTLNNERAVYSICGTVRRNLAFITRFAKETKGDGEPLTKNPVIRHKLAELAIEVEVTRLLYYRLASLRDKGITPAPHEISAAKVFGSDTMKHVVTVGMEIMGLHGQLRKGSKWASSAAGIEHAYLTNPAWALGGGSTEIQKNVIALIGLGMPR